MGKKNLDRLFQEKFKDFSEVPDEKVWKNISTSLDAKYTNRRIIPFWLKLGGMAALLAIVIYLIDPFDSSNAVIPAVTDIEKSKIADPVKEKGSAEPSLNVEKGIEEGLTEADSDSKKKDGIIFKEEQQMSSRDTTEKTEKTPLQHPIISGSQKSQVVQNNSKNKLLEKDGFKQEQVSNLLEDGKGATAISKNSKETSESMKNFDDGIQNNPKKLLQDHLNDGTEEGIAQTTEEPIEAAGKKSLLDDIDSQNAEEQLADQDIGNRWSVGASVAPVFYNSMGEGSPIHSSFVANSKSGDVNLSYGLSVAYALSKKLSIRSGINKVDYGYSTNDVEFSSSLSALNSIQFSGGQFENIDYASNSEDLVVESMEGFKTPAKDAAPELAGKSPARTGVMGQQFGYLEVPVELNYALLDKRFGVNLVGGLSSLFLVDNSVKISSGDLTTEIGEANNLNSVNFSGNIGFGVNYKFTPKVQLNIEPVFKYHLNTFSNTAGEFQPFTIGIYSGLNFRF